MAHAGPKDQRAHLPSGPNSQASQCPKASLEKGPRVCVSGGWGFLVAVGWSVAPRGPQGQSSWGLSNHSLQSLEGAGEPGPSFSGSGSTSLC